MSTCRYCGVSPDDAWVSIELAVALPAEEPLTATHVVVAPARHVVQFYELDVEEQRAVWDMVRMVQNQLLSSTKAERVHIGFDDSDGSGHTLIHVVAKMANEKIILPSRIEWIVEDPGFQAKA